MRGGTRGWGVIRHSRRYLQDGALRLQAERLLALTLGSNGVNATCPAYHPTSTTSCIAINTSQHCDNMSFRKPFSKVREKMKHGLSKIGDKLGRGEANVGSGGFDRSVLSLQSGPASLVVDGEVGGENSKTGGEGDPVPRSAVGSGHDLGETSHSDPHPLPHVEVESESSRGGRGNVDAPRLDVENRTPTPCISSRGGEPEGM